MRLDDGGVPFWTIDRDVKKYISAEQLDDKIGVELLEDDCIGAYISIYDRVPENKNGKLLFTGNICLKHSSSFQHAEKDVYYVNTRYTRILTTGAPQDGKEVMFPNDHPPEMHLRPDMQRHITEYNWDELKPVGGLGDRRCQDEYDTVLDARIRLRTCSMLYVYSYSRLYRLCQGEDVLNVGK